MRLNDEQLAILEHTLQNGVFCGGGNDMDVLCEWGYMRYIGTKSFVPDPYYKITAIGKKKVGQYD